MSVWTNQIWRAGQVAKGNAVRRSMHSVMSNSSPQELEREVRVRSFHMALIGDQYIIVCNPSGRIDIVR